MICRSHHIFQKQLKSDRGFSLIEVMITIGILMTLTIAVASMLRGGFDVRDGIAQRARVVHRLEVAINKVAADVEQAYFVSPKDEARHKSRLNPIGIFKIDKSGTADRLSLTTKTHRPLIAGSNESDLTYVVYELKDSKTAPGRKDLYRGETKVIPEDFKDMPPMRLLAAHIKSFVIETWNGERWMKNEYWDTGRGDTRNVLPRLVKITVEAWTQDREEDDGQDPQVVDETTDRIQTVVFVADSWEYEGMRQGANTIRWDSL